MGNYSFFDPISNVNYFGGFFNDAKQGLGRIYSQNKEDSKLLKGIFYNGDKQDFFEKMNIRLKWKKKINPNSRRKRMSIWSFGKLEITYGKKQCKSYILFEQNEITEKNENISLYVYLLFILDLTLRFIYNGKYDLKVYFTSLSSMNFEGIGFKLIVSIQ